MNEIMTEGLKLMVVGMGTVFIVLILVVIIAKILVNFINKYFPAEVKKVVKRAQTQVSAVKDAIDKKKLAAISASVEIITNGQGTVAKVEKV